jgi:hypothetical protein
MDVSHRVELLAHRRNWFFRIHLTEETIPDPTVGTLAPEASRRKKQYRRMGKEKRKTAILR